MTKPNFSTEQPSVAGNVAVDVSFVDYGTVDNTSGSGPVVIKKGGLVVRGADGKYTPFDIATAADVTAFITTNAPYAIMGVMISDDISVAATKTGQIDVLLKGVVDKEYLLSGTTKFSALAAGNAAKVENILFDAGIIPITIER